MTQKIEYTVSQLEAEATARVTIIADALRGMATFAESLDKAERFVFGNAWMEAFDAIQKELEPRLAAVFKGMP